MSFDPLNLGALGALDRLPGPLEMAAIQQARQAAQNYSWSAGLFDDLYRATSSGGPLYEARLDWEAQAEVLRTERWLAATSPQWREVMLDIEIGIWEPK